MGKMIDFNKIIEQYSYTTNEQDNIVYNKDNLQLVIKEAIKQSLPFILEEVANNTKTTPIYKPNCDDHTPYWGACVTCGRTDNPDVLIGEEVDKQSILSQQEEILKKLGI